MPAVTPRTPQETLPSRLERLLEKLTDRHRAERLERVYRAAALAIERLGHLNIVKYEPTSVEADGANLSLWETMAPAIRDTVVDVNALIAAVGQEFPPPPASTDERLWREVEAVLHGCAERLERRVSALGMAMRRPEVVSDGWTLLAELQAFRTNFRARIGDLVYLTAAAFEDVRREEVVPGYASQVAASAALRGAVVDLRRSLQGTLEHVAHAEPPALPALARRMEEGLAAFASLPASLVLRGPDKRKLVEARERLREAGARPWLSAEELGGLVAPFLSMLESVSEELTHDALTAHDRAVWAGCRERLEQAGMHLSLESPGAERILREALATAGALYGRDAALDDLLRGARAAPDEGLEEAELRETLERFRERLASLPFR